MAQPPRRSGVVRVTEGDETQRLAVELCRRTVVCLLDELSLGLEQVGENRAALRLRALEGHMREGAPDAIEVLNRCVQNAGTVEGL